MYIAIEWTSAAFHAWCIEDSGAVLDEKTSATGVNTISDGAFEAALRSELGDWFARADRVLLSGMITSRNGWVETPYAPLPAGPAEIAAGAVMKKIDGLPPLVFLPGVAQSTPFPDVMRGEEIAVLGAELMEAVVVLPGAHSKWVVIRERAIASITTYLTGELARLILTDSIIAKLLPSVEEAHPQSFDRGVEASSRLLGSLFSARSLVLFDLLKPAHIRSYVEGLLVGTELRELKQNDVLGGRIVLLGQSEISEKYERAATLLGYSAACVRKQPEKGFDQVTRHFGSSR